MIQELIQGIIFEYIDVNLTKTTASELSGRITKAILMTREGLGLPKEGIATNFSDAEVAGNQPEPVKPQEVKPEVHEGEKGAKAIVAKPEEPVKKGDTHKTIGIVSMPYGAPGEPDETAPIKLRVKK